MGGVLVLAGKARVAGHIGVKDGGKLARQTLLHGGLSWSELALREILWRDGRALNRGKNFIRRPSNPDPSPIPRVLAYPLNRREILLPRKYGEYFARSNDPRQFNVPARFSRESVTDPG